MKLLDEHRNVIVVVRAAAGIVERKHVQPIEEILAERPAGHGCVQITIRGSDDANVDVDRLSPPMRSNSRSCSTLQQCHLGVGR